MKVNLQFQLTFLGSCNGKTGPCTSVSTQYQYNVTGCGIMSGVWDMIIQWDSTIKVSIELPAATRHRRDMTEKLLKATLNPNTHTHIYTQSLHGTDYVQ